MTKTTGYLFFLLITMTTFMTGHVFAAETDTSGSVTVGAQEEAKAVAEASSPKVRISPTRELIKQKNDWLNTNPVGQHLKKLNGSNGFYLGWGVDVIPVSITDPAWAKHRQMAYERAVMNAEADFVKFQSTAIAANKVKDLFVNAELQAPDFKNEDLLDGSGKMTDILNKVLSFAEGKLDQALTKLDIDPKLIEKTPKAQRADKLKDSIMISSTAEAFGALSGYLPVQTFEGETSNGKNAIGVLMAVSPNLRQFAYDVLTKRGNIQPIPNKGGATISDQVVPTDATELLQDFGVRKIYDEEGYPVLISFGQWANSYAGGNDTIYAKYQEAAIKQARSQAENALAFYINGQTHWTNKSSVGNQVENYTLTHHDNFKEEKFDTTLTDIINEMQQSRASVTLSGLQQVYEWVINHPVSNGEVVGVVLAWSPRSEQSARDLREWTPSKETVSESKQDEPLATGKVTTKSSRTLMDAADF